MVAARLVVVVQIVRRTQQEGIEKLLPKPTQCPNELYSTMRRCCLPEVEARLPPRDMVKEIRAVLFRGTCVHTFLSHASQTRPFILCSIRDKKGASNTV